ncbi:MAG: class I tRNA ligase family protein, partial [Actinobacteria bacterium]|nr:class I tRNA ligase family protein [Actinomycetota bacterium]
MERFRPVDSKADFPAVERGVLEFWRERDVFRKSLELRAGAEPWIFYEGPPTANGKPGIHHVQSRTFKDVFPRYRTMTGRFVPRKAGWDCHGLPVELEVEKRIGTKSKRDIEEFGIAEFNRLCRRSVTDYVDDWERLTDRIGFWLDLSDAYRTMDPEYVESVWWSLKELYRQGLLFEDFKSVAYCPRCGTALSDHEVALGYRQVVDPSVYVRFEIVDAPDPTLVGSALVAWTTTPWTLVSNMGLAVAADEEYVEVEGGLGRLIVAGAFADVAKGEDGREVRRLRGGDLVGARYAPLYPTVEG